ncbi:unnamed protein product [Ascophyllum nodosum]
MEATDDSLLGEAVSIKGWVRTKRDQKTFSFVEVNDGSCMKGVQVVIPSEVPTYSAVDRLSTGASVAVEGVIVESPGKGQRFEVKAQEVRVIGECPSEYPLQKKRHTLEFLRGIAHLRPRTNTIAAVARVRSALAQATHDFFRSEGFLYLQSPLITASDCEGAGEMFRVTTLPTKVSEVPTLEDGSMDFSQDFFGKPAYLTVSGQACSCSCSGASLKLFLFSSPSPPHPRPTVPPNNRGKQGGGLGISRVVFPRSVNVYVCLVCVWVCLCLCLCVYAWACTCTCVCVCVCVDMFVFRVCCCRLRSQWISCVWKTFCVFVMCLFALAYNFLPVLRSGKKTLDVCRSAVWPFTNTPASKVCTRRQAGKLPYLS